MVGAVMIMMVMMVVMVVARAHLGVAQSTLVDARLIAGALVGAALLVAALLLAALFLANGGGAIQTGVGWWSAGCGAGGGGIEQAGRWADNPDGLGSRKAGARRDATCRSGRRARRSLLLLALVTQGLARSGGFECLTAASAAHLVLHTCPSLPNLKTCDHIPCCAGLNRMLLKYRAQGYVRQFAPTPARQEAKQRHCWDRWQSRDT
jgi:hypothetical protein